MTPRVQGPPNPIVKDPTGYEYRQMPARDWAAAAGLHVDVSALAWALASEAPSVERYPRYARAIGHAIMNASSAASISPHERVTMDGIRVLGHPARAEGHYGRQSGRWCASIQWPQKGHLGEAAGVHARLTPDHPARLWADLRIMDKGRQNGRPLQYDAAGIVRRRWLQRWAWVGPIYGIDPFVLCLFRLRVVTDRLADGLDMVDDGRRRWGFQSPPKP